MIVKCTKMIGNMEHEASSMMGDGNFLVGNYHYVLGMVMNKGKEPELILRAEDCGIPVLAPMTCFEAYTGYIPPNWIFRHTAEQGIYIQPAAWLEKDMFWEEFYQGKYIAQRLFDREVRIMVESEHPPKEILSLLIYPIPHYKSSSDQDYMLNLWDNFY